MEDKIMAGGNLEDIVTRLSNSEAVLAAICSDMTTSSPDPDRTRNALYGLADLLRVICRDFQADIDAAEDYSGT